MSSVPPACRIYPKQTCLFVCLFNRTVLCVTDTDFQFPQVYIIHLSLCVCLVVKNCGLCLLFHCICLFKYHTARFPSLAVAPLSFRFFVRARCEPGNKATVRPRYFQPPKCEHLHSEVFYSDTDCIPLTSVQYNR